MKKAESRKWLACLLAVAMLLAMLPAAALAQEDSGVTVYINGSPGNDANQGTSDKPVKSIEKAMELAGTNGTIVIVGTVYIRQDVKIENVTVERGENFTSAMFYVYSPSNVTVENAVIDGSSEKTLQNGGYIFSLYSGTVLNIAEGADIGNNSVVAINMSQATLNMSGGRLHDNSDDTGDANYGAAICAWSSTLNFTGGIIEDNYSTNSGAGVFAYGSSSILVDGAVFQNNRAEFNGGAIYIEAAEGGSSFKMNSGKIINNLAGYTSGGVFAYLWQDDMVVEITGGTIAGNRDYVEEDEDTGDLDIDNADHTGIALNYGYEFEPMEYPVLKLSGSPDIQDTIFVFDEETEGPVIEVTGELTLNAPIAILDDYRTVGRTIVKYADGITPNRDDFIAAEEKFGFTVDGQELKWMELLRVPFKTSDNSTTYDAFYFYPGSLIDPAKVPAPTQEGYTLEGWRRYSDRTLWDFEKDTVTESFTLLASWALNAPALSVEANQTSAHVGESITLTATASHDLARVTFSYEWYKDGTLIEGETGNTLTVTESGEYYVKVTAMDFERLAYAQSEAIACTIGHSFSEEWTSDESAHWHACSECDEKADEAEHTFKWVTDKEATKTEAGSKHEECSVCGFEKPAVEIPAQTGDYSNTGLWLILLLVSAGGLAAMAVIAKKRRA